MMIVSVNHFNIKQIAESGQCFRMNQEEGGRYSLVAFGRYLELCQLEENVIELGCTKEEYDEVWKDYFDIGYDYGRIVGELMAGEDAFLKQAAVYGSGIRILRQEPFEMLISFIISQNKNIPSIKHCIEWICERYGDLRKDKSTGVLYHVFPSAKQLAMAEKGELRELKLGYRDNYILSAAKTVAEDRISLEKLKRTSHEEAVEELQKIHGVGKKVANCVSLYGLHHIEAFPVDVWIKRILNDVYNNKFNAEHFKGYAGIIQQYMFFYIRFLKGQVKTLKT